MLKEAFDFLLLRIDFLGFSWMLWLNWLYFIIFGYCLLWYFFGGFMEGCWNFDYHCQFLVCFLTFIEFLDLIIVIVHYLLPCILNFRGILGGSYRKYRALLLLVWKDFCYLFDGLSCIYGEDCLVFLCMDRLFVVEFGILIAKIKYLGMGVLRCIFCSKSLCCRVNYLVLKFFRNFLKRLK